MLCPSCYSDTLEVQETINEDQVAYRKKRCSSCGNVVYTIENYAPADEIKPIFSARSLERVRKARAKAKGEEYVPEFERTGAEPKRPTQSLFALRKET